MADARDRQRHLLYAARRAGLASFVLGLSQRATVYRWLARWRNGYMFLKFNHAVIIADRERVSRESSPSAAINDSQRVKTIKAGGPRG